jgi:flagellar assembly protein FliH
MPLSNALRIWEYPEGGSVPARAVEPVPLRPEHRRVPPPGPRYTEEEVLRRVQEALAGAEQRWAAQSGESDSHHREQIQHALLSFAEERQAFFRQMESEVVRLALAMARKVLEREVKATPGWLPELARLTLERAAAASSSVVLRVSPADHALWEAEGRLTGPLSECQLIADPTVAVGECLLQTQLGSASLGLFTQFREVERAVLDQLEPSS